MLNSFKKSNKEAVSIDIDKIGHDVVSHDEKVKKVLKQRFGEKILENNVISRKKLSDLVFSNKKALDLLNRITLPAMCKEIENLLLSYSKYDYVILDYALLPNMKNIFNLCNYKILLESCVYDRKRRIIIKDTIDEDTFQKREDATIKYNTKDFDMIINNENYISYLNDMANCIVFHLNEKNKNLKIAYYPGSFDPITYGHMDIIDKALKIGFDKIIIAVTKNNSKKTPMFSLEERYNMIKELYKYNPNIDVVLIDKNIASIKVAKMYNCKAMIRGLRNVTDFEYEIDLSKVNSTISDVETIFLTASHKYDFISSSTTRELANLGEDISFYVPPIIKKIIQKKLSNI